VDLAFEDADGANQGTLSFGNVHDAESIGITNNALTGTLPSGSQGAGGATYLDTALTSLLASFGAADFQVAESTSGVARGLADTLFGIQLPVRGFGAKGDGLTVDTSAIQLAINRASARGGGRVYFDPGTYLIDSALSLPANVSLLGAGSSVTIIKQTNTSANGITAATAGNNTIQGIQITHSSTSSGIGISFVTSTGVTMRDVTVASAKFATGAKFDACSNTALYDCSMNCQDPGGAGTGRAIKYATSGLGHLIVGGNVTASTGTCVEFDTGTNGFSIFGLNFLSGTTGVRMTSSSNDDMMRVIGCFGLANNIANPFVETTSPASRGLYQAGNFIDGYTQDLTSGGNHTPSPILRGRYIRLRGTTTGAAYTVNALTTNPISRDFDFTIEFFNNAGGAVTGWTLNAMYHTSAAIPTADLAKTAVTFRWDSVASVAREVARAQTT